MCVRRGEYKYCLINNQTRNTAAEFVDRWNEFVLTMNNLFLSRAAGRRQVEMMDCLLVSLEHSSVNRPAGNFASSNPADRPTDRHKMKNLYSTIIVAAHYIVFDVFLFGVSKYIYCQSQLWRMQLCCHLPCSWACPLVCSLHHCCHHSIIVFLHSRMGTAQRLKTNLKLDRMTIIGPPF